MRKKPRGRKGLRIRRFIFTTCPQPNWSPLIDRCNGEDKITGEIYQGRAIRIPFTSFAIVVGIYR